MINAYIYFNDLEFLFRLEYRVTRYAKYQSTRYILLFFIFILVLSRLKLLKTWVFGWWVVDVLELKIFIYILFLRLHLCFYVKILNHIVIKRNRKNFCLSFLDFYFILSTRRTIKLRNKIFSLKKCNVHTFLEIYSLNILKSNVENYINEGRRLGRIFNETHIMFR